MKGSPIVSSALMVVALVWLGLVVGVSFIATPAKFLAPTLDLPVALDVGRHTFDVFSIVEVIALIGLVGLALACRRRLAIVVLSVIIVLTVALQQLWLLPVLDARVETVIQGGVPDDSMLHALYVGLEGVKVVVLIYLAWSASRLRDERPQ